VKKLAGDGNCLFRRPAMLLRNKKNQHITLGGGGGSTVSYVNKNGTYSMHTYHYSEDEYL
jgi:hypothetical protein